MSATREEVSAYFDGLADVYEDSYPLMKLFAVDAIKSVPPITSSSVVHDNACGPGVVTGAILSSTSFTSGSELPKIYATDLSGPMIKKLKTKPWADKVDAQVMNSAELAFPDATFTHSFTNFALPTMPQDDAEKAAAQIYRTLQPGGTAEISIFRKMSYLDLFKKAADQVKPGTVVNEGGAIPAHWMKEETLRDVLVAGGFKSEQIQIKSVSRDLPANAGMRCFNQLPVTKQITKGWEDAEREAFMKALEKLNDEDIKLQKSYEVIAWIAVANK